MWGGGGGKSLGGCVWGGGEDGQNRKINGVALAQKDAHRIFCLLLRPASSQFYVCIFPWE